MTTDFINKHKKLYTSYTCDGTCASSEEAVPVSALENVLTNQMFHLPADFQMMGFSKGGTHDLVMALDDETGFTLRGDEQTFKRLVDMINSILEEV